MRLKKYHTCVRDLQKHGLTRRQIAKLVGIDEAVLSRRLSKGEDGKPKQQATLEAVITINILADVYDKVEQVPINVFDDKGWLQQKIMEALELHELGKQAA